MRCLWAVKKRAERGGHGEVTSCRCSTAVFVDICGIAKRLQRGMQFQTLLCDDVLFENMKARLQHFFGRGYFHTIARDIPMFLMIRPIPD